MNDNVLVLLNEGVNQANAGNRHLAETYLKQVVFLDPYNETALLWLVWLTDNIHVARELLERVLVINPRNELARRYYEYVGVRTHNVDVDQLIQGSSTYRLWQRKPANGRQTPMRLGEYLISQGLITRGQLEDALTLQKQLEMQGKPRLIGKLLMDLSYISKHQLEEGVQGRVKELDTYYRE